MKFFDRIFKKKVKKSVSTLEREVMLRKKFRSTSKKTLIRIIATHEVLVSAMAKDLGITDMKKYMAKLGMRV